KARFHGPIYDMRDFGQCAENVVFHCQTVVPPFAVVFTRQVCSHPESNYKSNWQCSWAKSPLLAATVRNRFQRWATKAAYASNESTYTLWSINLMSADTQKVILQLAQLVDEFPKRLGCVNVEIHVGA